MARVSSDEPDSELAEMDELAAEERRAPVAFQRRTGRIIIIAVGLAVLLLIAVVAWYASR
ncbi:hypothetical protein HCU64_14520 [Methylobacterium sp. C25]|uniref:hypothetical protein n=1 Tax=Methylobacterium sp. C25 TaxID=2721622 RepID=UPI001F4162C1|nr:hypothetical protein [Methylobacterium sp. C25]MCE4224974.1 hypothetical protein [Methylobacterium sp. C25]